MGGIVTILASSAGERALIVFAVVAGIFLFFAIVAFLESLRITDAWFVIIGLLAICGAVVGVGSWVING
jgi:hypothetical protein